MSSKADVDTKKPFIGKKTLDVVLCKALHQSKREPPGVKKKLKP
jgi:hypothetical protein